MKKIAIIIGHRSEAQGAYSPYLLENEYTWNKTVASYLSHIADVYERPNTDMVSEGARIVELVNDVNKHEYDLVLSLHFNAFSDSKANGVTALYCEGNEFTKEFCEDYVGFISTKFETKARSLISIKNKYQNGGLLLQKLKAPAVLLEPFFGTNKEALQFLGQERAYAFCLEILINYHLSQQVS
ncbi:N-acetylmuramoyl-L-alanine amidase [Wenyingzhuangia sp. IMCC45574]